MFSLKNRSIAEFAGTAVLVMVSAGSGIMGTALSSDVGFALLIDMLATVMALGLLIFFLGPISGAHLNPIVTSVFVWRRTISMREAMAYVVAQIAGAITGAVTANVMFDQRAFQVATQTRSSVGLWIGEVIASAGLIIVIFVLIDRSSPQLISIAVPVWIGSAYFFTSSASFANPAVTIGRQFTNTFTGIAPSSVAGYVVAEFIGAVIGALLVRALRQPDATK